MNCTIKELDVFKNETECKVLQEAIDNLVYAMNETKWNVSNISLTLPIFYTSSDRLYRVSIEVNKESDQ